MKVEDKTLQALASALNFRKARQEIISSNIANAETPEFKAKRLEFEAALSRALDIDGHQSLNASDSRHFNVGSGGFDNLQPEVVEDPNGIVSEDGNTVDVEQEMVRMNENTILYNALVQLVNKKMGMMKYVIGQEK